MRKFYISSLFLLFASQSSGQFYDFVVTNGATVTIQSGSTVFWDGSLIINGNLNGGGMFQLLNNAQTITGTGNINNLRVSSGASVIPSNSLTIGNALDVTTGSSLDIPSSMYIVVNGPLSNAGTFNVDNDASLVQTLGSTLTNSGIFNVKRQGTVSTMIYNYWGSPITSAPVPGAYRYKWDANLSTQGYGDDQDPDPGWLGPFFGPMTPGVGYAATGAGLHTFTGTANNGDLPVPMVYHPYSPGNMSPGTPINLMSNPYPCAISCAALVAANPDVNGSIYFWDDDLSNGLDYSYTDYAVWNGTGSLGTGAGTVGAPNGFISSCQGFTIRALVPGAVLNFNNSMRVTGPNNQFFKLEEEPSRLWLSIEGDNNLFNQILIGMLSDATDGEDRLYDAIKSRGQQNIALACVNEEVEYCIMAFPPPLMEKTIPLNVFLAQAGTYIFHSNTIEGFEGYEIYLEDRNDFSYYPMTEGTQVPFDLAAGDHVGRFYLHVGPQFVTGVRDANEPNINAWIYDGMLTIQVDNLDEAGRLELIDMAGKQVWSSGSDIYSVAEKTTVDVSGLSRGVYVARIVTPSGIYSRKAIR